MSENENDIRRMIQDSERERLAGSQEMIKVNREESG